MGFGPAGTECAGVLLLLVDGIYQPVSLPLFGRYLGNGVLEEVVDGPNYDLVFQALSRLQQAGRFSVDWEALGTAEIALSNLEAFLEVLAVAAIHARAAVTVDGHQLSFALLSAHVAAALIAKEPQSLDPQTKVEDLPRAAFGGHRSPPVTAFTEEIYGALNRQSPRLRCRFGQSFVGLIALQEAAIALGAQLAPPDDFPERDLAASRQALALFLDAVGEDEELVDALADYAAQDEDVDES